MIGIPDPEWGQAVRAVVMKPGASLSEQELIQWCSQRLAGYKKPRSVIVVDQLPRSPVDKLLRAEIKKLYGAPLRMTLEVKNRLADQPPLDKTWYCPPALLK